MPAPREILDLVARFEQQLDAYRSGQYNETQVRREFLDPYFKALGWDIDNVQGFAEAYKDVIHEDQIRIAGATKAPDYCFRIGGTRKYFLEAKKPSVVIKDEPGPAYQLRRYAWSAKLPLSILSDFEEFAVYDGRVKPHKDDSASTARIFYCTFRDYADKWDWIVERFSRDAVLKGAFDKFAESTKTKRGTTEVDAAFLAEIEKWRSDLAKNLALRNPKLTQREINFAVQRTIDRIIFLRICEDRGIEDYGRLRALVNGDRIYPRLAKLFEQADDRYNSGLFHFKKEPGRHETPDELTLDLDVDDKLLRDLLRGLYYPDSPYEFSVLSADILGQVYEQFLGKVIRLTEGHRAVVDDKPEVKKAGGVYYTPTYIVDYIVRQTVGKLVADISGEPVSGRALPPHPDPLPQGEGTTTTNSGKSKPSDSDAALDTILPLPGGEGLVPRPREWERVAEGRVRGERKKLTAAGEGERGTLSPRAATAILNRVAKLRILDPACGSGSFLIGAYQFLLDWHLQFYLANDPVKFAKGNRPALVQTGNGWKLTIAERKRILLNNIYGVDIDAQAVEVTKLSLLLKVLEGETGQTLQTILKIFQERALPDLGDNIKCGNSLIGPDFYAGSAPAPGAAGDALVAGWSGRREGATTNARGARAPQTQLALFNLTDEERYRINVFDWQAEFPEIFGAGGFDAVIGNPPYVVIGKDLFSQSVVGYFSRFKVSEYKSDLFHIFIERGIELLRVGGRFGYIVPNQWFTLQFSEPLRRFILSKTAISEIVVFDHRVFREANVHTALLLTEKKVAPAKHQTSVRTVGREGLISILQATPVPFWQEEWRNSDGSVIETRLSGPTKKFVKRLTSNFPRLDDVARASLGCQAYNSSKHTKQQIANRVFHAPRKLGPEYLPELAGKDVLRYRIDRLRGEWIKYGPWLHDYRTMDWLDGPRILIREVAAAPPHSIHGCYAEEIYCHYKTILNVNPNAKTEMSMKYMLGLINSRLLSFLYPYVANKMVADTFPRLSVGDVKKLPIRVINFSDNSDKAAHDRMVKLVEQMLELHKQLAAARTPQEQTALERQIAATDTQIDRLVYDLYGLTEDEIKIVEGKADTVTAAEPPMIAASKAKRIRKKPAYAKTPPGPSQPGITPEKAYADAAHHYGMGKEEAPPYQTEGEQP